MQQTFAVGIGGAAGQGVATPGDIFAKIFSRRGLHLNAYNAYQSIIRGGHTFLTIRTGPEKVTNMGDRIDLLIPLNQDAVNRHLGLLIGGAACIYNADTIKPGAAGDGVHLCPLPVSKLADITRNKVAQNTLAVGAGLSMMGIGFQTLEEVIAEQFTRKGEAVVAENVAIARAGYDYATSNFKPFAWPLPMTENRYAVLSGNAAMAMGGAAAGVKFYCAYPMSPSTGVLHWMAAHARKAGIMVRQVEDEIGVVNMAIGAAHAGVRSMCATSGGGFALMSEGLGMSAMMETPVVVIDCQRAGPSTGVPTKTEQGDLWQTPRAIPGVPGHIHTAATDEHDEDGVLISDEFTNPIKRRAMMEKRMRKVVGIEAGVPPPELWGPGPRDADVTLIGWGSTKGVIEEACEILSEQGISANQLQIRWLVPLHGEAILDILKDARHTIIVENNYSGQFARYLRSETSYVPSGCIRKYDGEPFMPHHIVEAVKEQLGGKTKLSVPAHEIMV